MDITIIIKHDFRMKVYHCASNIDTMNFVLSMLMTAAKSPIFAKTAKN